MPIKVEFRGSGIVASGLQINGPLEIWRPENEGDPRTIEIALQQGGDDGKNQIGEFDTVINGVRRIVDLFNMITIEDEISEGLQTVNGRKQKTSVTPIRPEDKIIVKEL